MSEPTQPIPPNQPRSTGSAFQPLEPVLLFLIAMAAFRLLGLFDYCLDWDEANTLAMAKLGWSQLWQGMVVRYHHHLGTIALIKLWISVLGSQSDFILRILSWSWGVLGIGASFGLTFELTRNKRMAYLTALLITLSPFLIKYSGLVTAYFDFYPAAILSWWALLRLAKHNTTESHTLSWAWIGVYTLSILLATQTFVTSLWVWGVQLIWCLWQWKTLSNRCRWVFIISSLIILVAQLPLAYLIAQPWYIIHQQSVVSAHPTPPFSLMLIAPVNLLWLRYDLTGIDAARMPSTQILYIVGALGYIILWLSGKAYLKRYGKTSFLWVCLTGLFPILATLIISLGFKQNIFHFRTLLPCIFPLALLLASGVENLLQQKRRWLGTVLMCGLGLSFLNCPYQNPRWNDVNWQNIGKLYQADRKPGDGLVIYPGYFHLPFLRYAWPEQFGYTPHEINADPRKENLFQMLQASEEDLFIVSGEDLLKRTDVQQKLKAFQARHQRLVFYSFEPVMLEALDCTKTLRVPFDQEHMGTLLCDPIQQPAHASLDEIFMVMPKELLPKGYTTH